MTLGIRLISTILLPHPDANKRKRRRVCHALVDAVHGTTRSLVLALVPGVTTAE
jgi:hypothetical protein